MQITARVTLTKLDLLNMHAATSFVKITIQERVLVNDFLKL